MDHLRSSRLLVCLLGLVLAGSLATAGSASTTTAASLCTTAKGLANTLSKPPTAKTLSVAQGQALLKTNLSKVLAAKGALLQAAPSSLKGDMSAAIGFLGLLNTDLQHVGWNFAALLTKPALVTSLGRAEVRAEPSFGRIRAYFDHTCRFK